MMNNLITGVLLLFALGAGPAWAQPSAPDFPGAANIPAGNYGISKRSAADLALPDR